MKIQQRQKTTTSSSKSKSPRNTGGSAEYHLSVIDTGSYVRPLILEGTDTVDPWVDYGVDNNYFGYVTDRYYGSPTNNALINSISEMIYGGGLRLEDGSEADEELLMEMFPPEEVKKIAFDYKQQGNAAFEVIWNREGGFTINHLPVETLRPQKANENGEIEAYWFSNDWERWERRKGEENKPFPIPAWGFGRQEGKEILYIKKYSPNTFYFSPPDYQGAIPYAELEEEIANYHINNIKNAFAPSALINYNNGVPNKTQRDIIEAKTHAKFTGSSNSGKLVVAFNRDKDSAATIDTFQLSDAHNQYEFLSNEARKQLMVGHRVTSPILFGIKDDTGFGNNADELRTASMMFDAKVIRPFQDQIIDVFNIALNEAGKSEWVLFFENIEPLEVTGENQDPEGDNRDSIQTNVDPDTQGQEGTQLSKDIPSFTNDMELLEHLVDLGEEIDEDEWELIDARPVDYETDHQLHQTIKFASVVSSSPQKKSEQDNELFRIRYGYAPTRTSTDSRDFCIGMVSAKKVYRKEDIEAAGSKAVNPGFGKGGSDTYSIWLYKGGARCHHFWERRVYLKKNNKKISANEARRIIVGLAPSKRSEVRPTVNDPRVAKRPIDMPNEGFVKPQ